MERIRQALNYIPVGIASQGRPASDDNDIASYAPNSGEFTIETLTVVPRDSASATYDDDDGYPPSSSRASSTLRIFDGHASPSSSGSTPALERSQSSILSTETGTGSTSDGSSWDSLQDDEDDSDLYDHEHNDGESPPSPTTTPSPAISLASVFNRYHYSPQWTTEIPLELVEAAIEEEQYLARQEREAEAEEAEDGGSSDRRGGDVECHCGEEEGEAPTHSDQDFPIIPFPPEMTKLLDKPTLAMAMRARHTYTGYSSVELTSSVEANASSIIASPTLHNFHSQEADGVEHDKNALPVPCHAVLRHLSTSPIKNGVLGVAYTYRYKNKFPTTIYYRPID